MDDQEERGPIVASAIRETAGLCAYFYDSVEELVRACQSMTLHHNQGQFHAIDIQRVKVALAKMEAKS